MYTRKHALGTGLREVKVLGDADYEKISRISSNINVHIGIGWLRINSKK